MVAIPHVGVDVGGTFTDVVLVTGSDLVTTKVPTTADQSEGVLDGIRKACDRAGIDPADVATFTHGMTVSVNALLERDGAETALVTTEGFRDVLEIGRQTRPSLYDLDAERTPPLVPRRRRYELDERTTTEGVETPVDSTDVDALVEKLTDAESVAVSLLHAYSAPENEVVVAERLRERLDVPVSVSHEVLPAFREYERTSTTVADAYVRPAIDSYLGRLTERTAKAGVPAPRVMQSNGGIADPETVRKHAVTTVMSGPAAGVVGAQASAERAVDAEAFEGFVTFDMGGTSSDVSLVRDGDIARTT
ncbi:hydantoinase/oxoprolinase family protein, partial [Natronomonas sp.]|uniref:hydantoinase/oxoprolinase family protein n=1 Tax=Natronomonas sp. TaxID=2184060 RepID=UPI002FC3CBDB